MWNLAVVLAARGFSQHFSAQPALRFPPLLGSSTVLLQWSFEDRERNRKGETPLHRPLFLPADSPPPFFLLSPPPLFFLSPGQDKYGLMKIGKSNLSFRPGKARGGKGGREKGKRRRKWAQPRLGISTTGKTVFLSSFVFVSFLS